jgi:hypothetical protein
MPAALDDDHWSSRAVPECYRTLAVQGGMKMVGKLYVPGSWQWVCQAFSRPHAIGTSVALPLPLLALFARSRATGRPVTCTAPAGTARHRWRSMLVWSFVVLRAEISFLHEEFRRVVRGVRGEALKQQHPSPAESIMNLWFRLCRAGFHSRAVGLLCRADGDSVTAFVMNNAANLDWAPAQFRRSVVFSRHPSAAHASP